MFMAQTVANLQIARAIAASMVVLGHTLREAFNAVPNIQPAFAPSFGVGVDVFFVISGFIMAYISDGRIGQPGYAGYFLRSRIARVVPLYWFYTLLLVAATVAMPQLLDNASFNITHILTSLAFYPWAPTGDIVQPILALGWTLNYEMMFYGVFFVLLLCLSAHMVLPAIASLFGFLALVFAFVDLSGTPFAFWFRPIILEFVAGIALFAIYKSGLRLNAHLSWVLLVASIFAWLALPQFLRGDPIGWRWLQLGVPAALFVASLTLRKPSQKPSNAAKRFAILVGDSSYTLYLSHPFVLTIVYVVWSRLGLFQSLGVSVYVIVTCFCCVCGAIIGYWLIEKPISKLTRSWVKGSTGKTPVSIRTYPVVTAVAVK
jgi:peptidoglycan/LPS O-acetylase OafA/YrhL